MTVAELRAALADLPGAWPVWIGDPWDSQVRPLQTVKQGVQNIYNEEGTAYFYDPLNSASIRPEDAVGLDPAVCLWQGKGEWVPPLPAPPAAIGPRPPGEVPESVLDIF